MPFVASQTGGFHFLKRGTSKKQKLSTIDNCHTTTHLEIISRLKADSYNSYSVKSGIPHDRKPQKISCNSTVVHVRMGALFAGAVGCWLGRAPDTLQSEYQLELTGTGLKVVLHWAAAVLRSGCGAGLLKHFL